MPSEAEVRAELVRRMTKYQTDPLGHVLYSYPWGKGPLEHCPGPRKWQKEILEYLGERIRSGNRDPIRIGVRSGNGPGKTSLLALVVNWAMSCFPDARGNITAETEPQLRTKTWPEISKWFEMFVAKHWFKKTATTISSLVPGHEETWKIDRLPWSENNPEAFAGLHNSRKIVVIIMDEGSAIADVIFETAEGAWTDEDTIILCLAFGNPTRNEGYFYDIFDGKYAHRWKTWTIDSREVEGTNKEQIRQWAEDRGEDSDWFRVHVRGLPPKATEMQYISRALVEQGLANHVTIGQYGFAPKIIGVDPAWSGGDEINIVLRQGLASWLLATIPKNDDDTRLGGILAALDDEHHADAVFIDQGYGTGVFSYGKMIGRKHWQLVSFAESPIDPYYENKRMEMYAETKKWLKEGGCLPDKQMGTELTYPEAFVNRKGHLQLESKDDLKARGLPSPGRADALVLTFARKVKPRDQLEQIRRQQRANKKYDPLSHSLRK